MSTGISFKTAIGIFILLAVVLFLIGAVFFYAMLYLRGINIEPGETGDFIPPYVEYPHPPAWFPDGGRLAFSHAGGVYVIDSAGSHLQLVDGGGDDGEFDLANSPSVSPDGSRIAYAARFGAREMVGAWEIVTAKPDGSDKRRLTEDDRLDIDPVWAPDGTSILFEFSPGNYRVWGIGVVAPDGSGALKEVYVASGPGPIVGVPMLSPDGSQIAFSVGDYHSGNDLYLVGIDGSGLTWLDMQTSLAAWSPDGQRIAYAKREIRDDEYVAAGIYTVGIDGSDVREIISFPSGEVSWIENISWSPDGSEILYGTTVIAADGSAMRELPISGSHASWSPDGSKIAVYNEVWPSGDVLYTVARDGTDARVLCRAEWGRKPVCR